MPISDMQREVATIALRVAARYGFALAGGNALIAHGVIDRPTEDVDLFSDQETGVVAAADAVEAALQAAGFTAERQDGLNDLGDVFEGMGDLLASAKPDIFCEVLPRADAYALTRLLAPLGYSFWLLTERGPERREDVAADPSWSNWLFTPRRAPSPDDPDRPPGAPARWSAA
jgi:hypothetical protein